MPKRIVDVIVEGHILRSEEVSWFGLPWARPLSDDACIASALEELFFQRFEVPANATFRVRDL